MIEKHWSLVTAAYGKARSKKRAFIFPGAEVFDNSSYHKLFPASAPNLENRFETGEFNPENA
jgi:hypothetical protein